MGIGVHMGAGKDVHRSLNWQRERGVHMLGDLKDVDSRGMNDIWD